MSPSLSGKRRWSWRLARTDTTAALDVLEQAGDPLAVAHEHGDPMLMIGKARLGTAMAASAVTRMSFHGHAA
jgi:hypothetical protein